MLQKAFRDCTMTVKEIDLQHRQKTDAIHFAFRPQDPEKDIPMKPVGAAPPGLATPISGQLESHGNHVYFNYTGRWKNGHMRGPMGVYLFADGGKYVGTWKDSLQCGSGVAVCTPPFTRHVYIFVGISKWSTLLWPVERRSLSWIWSIRIHHWQQIRRPLARRRAPWKRKNNPSRRVHL